MKKSIHINFLVDTWNSLLSLACMRIPQVENRLISHLRVEPVSKVLGFQEAKDLTPHFKNEGGGELW